MDSVLIRQISRQDIESFHCCLDSVARERKYLGFITAPSLTKTRTSLIEDMARDVIRLIAIDRSKVVGWCQIKSGKWEGYTHMGWLQMGVHKEYRGQGIGTALLSHALQEARSQGLERVELGVYAPNLAAIRLYKKYESRPKVGRREPGNLMEVMTMLLTWRCYSMRELLM